MIRHSGLLLAYTILVSWIMPVPAYAQDFGIFSQEEATPEPPQEMPPMPEGAEQPVAAPEPAPQPQSSIPMNAGDYMRTQKSVFPALPPSRRCTAGDLTGIWKLAEVHEDPEGAETLNFSSNKYQYIMFQSDSVYAKHTSSNVELPPAMVRVEMEKQSQALHQYLVNEEGVIFFYNQGVAVDSLACFIVANERGSFVVGQMILMPPKGQYSGRLAKVYSRYSAVEPRQKVVRDTAALNRLPPPKMQELMTLLPTVIHQIPDSMAPVPSHIPDQLPPGLTLRDVIKLQSCVKNPACKAMMQFRIIQEAERRRTGGGR